MGRQAVQWVYCRLWQQSQTLGGYFHPANQTEADVISQRDHPPPLAAGHDTQGTLCVTQIDNEVSSYHYYLASYGLLLCTLMLIPIPAEVNTALCFKPSTVSWHH